MGTLKILLFSLLLTLSPHFQKPRSPSFYLAKKIPASNFRYKTFFKALSLMEERHLKTLVETGTARHGDRDFWGNGGSTIIYAQWASVHQAELFSIDISSISLQTAEQAVRKWVPGDLKNIHFICSDSVTYLKNFGRQIDFLYLDSLDYERTNPLPSQLHHLHEIEAAYPFLTEKSVVMIDDHNLPGGGKGKFAVEFLLNRGWEVLMEDYQIILIKSRDLLTQ